jgi:hypothetical protein
VPKRLLETTAAGSVTTDSVVHVTDELVTDERRRRRSSGRGRVE